MKKLRRGRRQFLKDLAGSAALMSSLPAGVFTPTGSVREERSSQAAAATTAPAQIKFAVIGINHSHINSQVDAVLRGGGELVSVYAKEPDLLAAFAEALSAGEARAQRERDPRGLEPFSSS